MTAAWTSFQVARDSGNVNATQDAVRVIETCVQEGSEDFRLWRAIGGEIDRLKALRQSEAKRLIEMRQTITQERAMVLVSRMINAVRESIQAHIEDASIARAIFGDISRELDRTLIEPAGSRIKHTS